jgi:prephenate dehydratase
MPTDMRTGVIAFQGENGANSDTACRAVFPAMTPLPCATFEDAFNAVDTGEAALAMIPIENTIAGRVADIHHILPQSNLFIIGEFFLPIHFQLMVLPGTPRSAIRTVHSHIHALGQCRKYIRANGWKGVVASDMKDASQAALAPELAASLYGLDIIEKDVEDAEGNVTRFVVLSKTPEHAPQGHKNGCVTTFIFRVRNIPAALYKAMGGFATNAVNMTKLESYQLGGAFTATQFYADIEGHPDDRNVRLALEELRFFSEDTRILGVYPAHPVRHALNARLA